jgi:hypothetical protein
MRRVHDGITLNLTDEEAKTLEERGWAVFLETLDALPALPGRNVVTTPAEPSEDFTPEEARETRMEQIQRWEDNGWLDPNCRGCQVFYDSTEKPVDVFAPGHRSNHWCKSGGRPHCTCGSCF